MSFAPTDLIAIFGKRGSGKSTLCQFIQKSFPRVLVLDLMNEYPERDGDTVVRSLAHLQEVVLYVLRENVRRYRIIFKLDVVNADITTQARALLRIAQRMGDLVLVLEEMHEVFPQDGRDSDEVRKLVLLGRHAKVGIIGTSQRAALVSKTFVTQCSHVFVSRMVEANDLRYFKNTLGVDDNALRKLPDYNFAYVHNGTRRANVKAPLTP